jgi:hypothetical protein
MACGGKMWSGYLDLLFISAVYLYVISPKVN